MLSYPEEYLDIRPMGIGLKLKTDSIIEKRGGKTMKYPLSLSIPNLEASTMESGTLTSQN